MYCFVVRLSSLLMMVVPGMQASNSSGRSLFLLLVVVTLLTIGASAAGEQGTMQQQDVLSSQYTWASLVDGTIDGSLSSSSHSDVGVVVGEATEEEQPLEEEEFVAAIETENENQGEAEAETEAEEQLEEQSEGEAEVDSEMDASVDTDVSTESSGEEEFSTEAESDAVVEAEAENELDAEASEAILMELSQHMDVSAILEHEEHQQMYKPKAAAAAAKPAAASTPAGTSSAASSTGAAKSARGSAASRLTKDVQAAKFKSFTTKRNRKYASPAEAATAFQTFSKNRETIVALNDKTAAGRPAVFKSSGPFADKAPGQFAATRTTSKIQLDRAKGKAVRIKRKSSTSGSSSTTSSGHTAGMSGGVAGQSGKTGGKSGKTAGQSGKTGGKSGKTAGQSGKTGGKSGKTGAQSGKTGGKSGKTGAQSGKTGGKSGKTGGNSGTTAAKSGKTGGNSGTTGAKSGKTGGNSGTTGTKSGKIGGTSGNKGSKSGKTGGNKDIALQPVLPPSAKTDAKGKTLPTDIGVTADGIKAGLKAAGVSDADIAAAFDQLKGEYKKGGDIGMDLFGYQKGDCGSCWAHAAGDALTRLWKKQQNWISNELIAVQQVLDCVHTKDSNGCHGGSPMDAIDYWSNNPIALLKEYPLMDHTGKCKAAPFGGRDNYRAAFGWEMSLPACTDSKGDCKGQIALEALLLKWLKGNSLTPIVYVDASQWQHYSGGIFPLSACSSTTAKGNHIVQIVGYGTDTASGVPYWVIRNSWSRSWGEDGQIRIPFGVNACGLLNFVISVSDPNNDALNQADTGSSAMHLSTNQDINENNAAAINSRSVEGTLTKSQIIARMQVKANENLSTDPREFTRNNVIAQQQFDQVQQKYANLDASTKKGAKVTKVTSTSKTPAFVGGAVNNPNRDAAVKATNEKTGVIRTDAQAQTKSNTQAGTQSSSNSNANHLTPQQNAILQQTASTYVAGAEKARQLAGVTPWNAKERAAGLKQMNQIIARVQQLAVNSDGPDDANMSHTLKMLASDTQAQLFMKGGVQEKLIAAPGASAALDAARQAQLQRALSTTGAQSTIPSSSLDLDNLKQVAVQSGNADALKSVDFLAKMRAEHDARQAAFDAQLAAQNAAATQK